MTRLRSLVFILTLCITPSVFAQTEIVRQPSVDLPAELDRVLRDYEQAWEAGDGEALAALFTDKGHVPIREGWVKGFEAIRNKYKNAGGDLQLRAIDFGYGEEVGFIVGAYGYGDEGSEVDRGNFVLALRKTPKGKWLIVADLDKQNSR